MPTTTSHTIRFVNTFEQNPYVEPEASFTISEDGLLTVSVFDGDSSSEIELDRRSLNQLVNFLAEVL